MQNAFLRWFLPRHAIDGAIKALVVMGFIVMANIGFAEFYLGYQPDGIDYVLLNAILVVLPWCVIFMMALYRERRLAEHLLRLTRIDGLTGLLNRNTFLAEVTAQASSGREGVVLMVDADHFKTINDRFGHRTGDICLQNIAARLQHTLRSNDLAGRLGGEEFGVYLDGVTLEQGKAIVARLMGPIRFRDEDGRGLNAVTLSVGAAAIRKNDDISERLCCADKALYAAKAAGRACSATWHDDIGQAFADHASPLRVVASAG